MRRRHPIALWLTILLIGCMGSSSPELGMRSSDSEFMHQFVTELQAAQVQFRTDVDGMIRYHARDKDVVNAIAERVRKEMSTGTSLKFEKDEQKRHFLAELDAAKKKFEFDQQAPAQALADYMDLINCSYGSTNSQKQNPLLTDAVFGTGLLGMLSGRNHDP